MLDKILSDEKFANMMSKNVKECLEFLLEKGCAFSVLVNLSLTKFEPELPENLKVNFKLPAVLFELDGYTLESAYLDGDGLKFHAGFGEEMFESYVSVKFGGIVQILVEQSPVLVNFSIHKPKKETKRVFKPL
ncbi:MAG: hypothetical protein MR902_06635 [Campylobacter sp.]|nr:hypothetical protein [Campylobacter sp.]